MEQVTQIAGSLCVLVPFVLAQFRRMDSQSIAYAGLNLIGSTVLSVQAAQGHQWGFLLLEGVWACVSLLALLRAVTRPVAEGATILDRRST
ncbi:MULTISPECIES: CBU_0592 family membrane protein [Rhodococcus]|uniref:CBU_0592 family membrane protein n=1 Tax=Rhodococcus pyridinivorans TaxID=103816 RepID=UPI001AFA89A5|nr:hypothetical protein [Rhodococcus pyridinivorans]QOH59381.1 hypothetical protein C6Y44_24935 [Rhodococcus rhodochrous]